MANLNFLSLVLTVFTCFICANSQFFHPSVNDKTYLDTMEADVKAEVEQASVVLLAEAKVVQDSTKEYIGAKLKENVFKALRVLAEQEMSKLEQSPTLRRKFLRQEAEEGDAGSSGGAVDSGSSGAGDSGASAEGEASASSGTGESGAAEEAVTELTGLGTAVKINQNVFKFIGDAFKIIVKGLGGKVRKLPRLTKVYVDEAPSLMNEPYADQLLGLTVLMMAEGGQEADNLAKYRKIDQSDVINVLFHRERSAPKNTEGVVEAEEHFVPNLSGYNVESLVTSFKESVGEVKDPSMLLDLFRGVRESYKFLDAMSLVDQTISSTT